MNNTTSFVTGVTPGYGAMSTGDPVLNVTGAQSTAVTMTTVAAATIANGLPNVVVFHPFFMQLHGAVRALISLCIMVFGCTANIVTLIAMSHTRITRAPRGLLLVFMTVADNLYLTFSFVAEMSSTYISTLSPGCAYIYFILYSFKLWAYLLTIMFLTDRVVAVKHPKWYDARESRFWTTVAVIVSFVASAAASAFLLAFVHYDVLPGGTAACVVLASDHGTFLWYLGAALIGLGEAAPELTALMCTGWVIYSLVLGPDKDTRKAKQEPSQLPKEEMELQKTRDTPNGDLKPKESENAKSSYCTLVSEYTVEASVIGGAMVVCCVPQTVSFMYFNVTPPMATSGSPTFSHALVITQTLALSYHGIKIILYACASSVFRENLKRLCLSCNEVKSES